MPNKKPNLYTRKEEREENSSPDMDAATNMLNTRISYRTVTKVTLPTFSTARARARLG